MREVLEVLALPEWTVAGKVYKASLDHETHCPPELDGHITFHVGQWTRIDHAESLRIGLRLRRAVEKDGEFVSEKDDCPTLQRFAFRIVQLPETIADLKTAFAGINTVTAAGVAVPSVMAPPAPPTGIPSPAGPNAPADPPPPPPESGDKNPKKK